MRVYLDRLLNVPLAALPAPYEPSRRMVSAAKFSARLLAAHAPTQRELLQEEYCVGVWEVL